MSYRVNGKNLALGRLIVRGPKADKRLKYIHVSPRGTTVVTPNAVARVTLPLEGQVSSLAVPCIVPQKDLPNPTHPGKLNDPIDLVEGLPAVTQPEYAVPQVDKMFPGPENQTETFTCNAEELRRLLTVACEVSEDSTKTIRIRFCPQYSVIRIDNYRQPGDQEFCAVLKSIDYEGTYIPGEPEEGAAKPEKKPVQRPMMLRLDKGRRFRGENE